ncbi:Hsp20/alpha crystallin family protein [Fibrella sp. HMF5335]|uniref:Hsp20/alpha crystallin family protein n=1 Tax=Fibrella rubiginis TaxID=2817060 RepID=A0A939GHY1_9BACT|nr:Hsp20/alpha crystallin family protein [Fibrella rubiginis]MBO0936798.1 Hsp20/alpha crystallin family protein [Fibrella rubiginis]
MNTLMRSNGGLPSLIENIFSRDMNDFFSQTAMQNVPAVNVVEHNDGFRIEVAAPGLKKEDFKLNLNHNNLTISAYKEERQEQQPTNGTNGESQQGQQNRQNQEKYARREFSYTSFQRTFMLPSSVDADQIKASYEDGVLKIEIPKREEAKVKPPRQIEIGG